MRKLRTHPKLLSLCLLPLLVAAPRAVAGEPEPVDSAPEALERAALYATEGRWEEVRELAEWALAANPENERALRLRAEARRRTDRFEGARDDYLRLTRLRPEDPDPWFWIGTIERWSGRSDEALEAYAHALTLDLDHHGALTGHARVQLAAGRPAAAEAELRRALAAHPDDPEASRLLAAALAAQGRVKEGRRSLEAAFTGAELAREQGDLEMAAGRPAKALEHYQSALRQEPGNADTLRRLGDAGRQRGDDQAALAAFRRAAELDPGHVGSLYWVGVLATRAGRLAEALAAWEAILRIEPDNVAALVGKARVLLYRGRRQPALTLTERALEVAPDNGEARTLRASILAASGRLREAGSDYRAVLTTDPGNGDARIGFERLADSSSWEISGRSDVSRVVEGLDDEGLVVGGVEIRPTRVEYRTEGVSAQARARIGNGDGFAATISQRRESVTQLDSGNAIYDLDVAEASAGLDHRLTDGLRFSWRVGGSRYEPRAVGSIAEESRGLGRATLEWHGGRVQARVQAEREPFIYRGFAGDTQFRIFDHDRLSLRLGAMLGGGVRVEATGGVSQFGGDTDSDSPAWAGVALRWRQGRQAGALVLHHSPFPERFLTEGGSLRFIDYDAARLELRSELDGGFRVELDAETGRYGATARTVEVGGAQVAGPLEENDRVMGRLTLAWSPRGFRPLSVGLEAFVDEYDFDTGPYNTIDTVAGTAFVEVGGETARAAYGLRLESSRIDDDRDEEYDRHAVSLRLEGKLGGRGGARGSTRVGIDGRYSAATLDGQAGEFDEELPRLRLYLRVPF